MPKNISLKEIAKLAGVSTATVSRVINNNGRFSEKTRLKVERVIQFYDYKPNKIAKGLRARRTDTIGIIVPDILNTYYSSVVQEIEEKFFSLGYSTVICNTESDSKRTQEYFEILEGNMVDGIILVGGANEINLDDVETPFVCIDREPRNKEIYFVGSDNYSGAKKATQYLSKQTNDITFVLKNTKTVAASERLKGFQDIVSSNKEIKGVVYHYKGESNELSKFLKEKTQKNNFGIFAMSDSLAVEILMAAYKLNITVPEKMKLVGFDDAPVAKICYPQLTTVKQNIKEISSNACELLVKLIRGEYVGQEERNKRVAVELVKRGTV
ncbi:LacI family DNA-binding transcriptional regulator [Ligilactobacillus pobuzihii]|uniref:LacI family transcription regulator n=1 Tax=Ligilactobacillus pobuzihii TaxID=449659 RepID=A0A0R2LDU0_9LACO|nr:LacI family DNA-binding transcriptional regulator [Ligilactobacillus pobuzihii]KRK08934.1 LacI family transcription regulator [Ligilactobacillus pobuzihii E100301 = KCTC 13174]KRN99808.1 LacI family transcription regulator [Ligilactobacillus pobuzihii]GEN49226.1 LacI family transcriptional regulator [Ligilactobacillus pobuzihii]